jgi:flagellar basal-body rod modification protein FlgD
MSVSSEITAMQNQTAFYKLQENRNNAGKSVQDVNDSNMFLTLMLQQLQNQDPTEPTDNTEWLAQLAQYSSLEQMTQMNQGLANCMQYVSSIYNDMTANSEITQTLALIGKEVTLKDPDDPAGVRKITGKVSEASFEDGTGKIKVGDKFYSIAYIVNVKDNSLTYNTTANNTETNN